MAFTPTILSNRPSELLMDQVGTIVASGTAVPSGLRLSEHGSGAVRTTVFTFTAMSMSFASAAAGSQFAAQKIYTFPKGIIRALGGVGTLTFTTTSDDTTTLNSAKTVQWGVGSVTASADTLATTMINMLPGSGQTVPTYTSAAQNVASSASNFFFKGPGTIGLDILDGTSTAIAAFLNMAVATDADLDAAATVTVTERIALTWMTAGAYANS